MVPKDLTSHSSTLAFRFLQNRWTQCCSAETMGAHTLDIVRLSGHLTLGWWKSFYSELAFIFLLRLSWSKAREESAFHCPLVWSQGVMKTQDSYPDHHMGKKKKKQKKTAGFFFFFWCFGKSQGQALECGCISLLELYFFWSIGLMYLNPFKAELYLKLMRCYCRGKKKEKRTDIWVHSQYHPVWPSGNKYCGT